MIPYFEMTPARTKIGTSEKPTEMTSATENAIFFLSLLALLTTLHDHYQPVHAYRARHEPSASPAGSEG